MNSQNRRTAGRVFAIGAALVLALAPVLAEARAGKGGSFGSRGANTQKAAPPTATAPGQTQNFQRSQGPSQAAPAAPARPGAAPAAAGGGMFSSPMARGLMAGLVGAGIVGLLMGSGLFSGLGSLASILGLLLQLALIGGIIWLAVSWWRRRQQPAMATGGYDRTSMGPAPVPPAPQAGPTDAPRSALPGIGSGLGAGAGLGLGAAASRGFGSPTRPLKLDGPDFERFEKLLEEVQGAYAREDIAYLRRISTEEMAGYFQEDLEEQESKGVVARSGGVKLLDGDLSEAWAEASGEYATVAMRYEITDALVDRETGRVVEGDLTKPQEVTEVWTFVRAHESGPQGWLLSAIQQVEEPTQH